MNVEKVLCVQYKKNKKKINRKKNIRQSNAKIAFAEKSHGFSVDKNYMLV